MNHNHIFVVARQAKFKVKLNKHIAVLADELFLCRA